VVVGLNPSWKSRNPTHQIIRNLSQDVSELREPLLRAFSFHLSKPQTTSEQSTSLLVTTLFAICSFAKDTKQEDVDATLLSALIPAHNPLGNNLLLGILLSRRNFLVIKHQYK
jgi:hypothetical protein